jgi:hypothetical protein
MLKPRSIDRASAAGTLEPSVRASRRRASARSISSCSARSWRSRRATMSPFWVRRSASGSSGRASPTQAIQASSERSSLGQPLGLCGHVRERERAAGAQHAGDLAHGPRLVGKRA